ncbi:hypothetical protein P3TCK_11124 [Photobacterium profundum 3TCK]|uniref:Uncharacterized protein n=1 Tax=Photobacterium profundum 3TCK TaxID=314280 RepID=Q1YVN2_9GAMM|nr:hypothetical protein P3TCK_11124 [Photobacterium profundum 3TCK]
MLFLEYLDNLEFTTSEETEMMMETYEYIINE